MLVSLKKNKWLISWIKYNWNDEFLDLFEVTFTRPVQRNYKSQDHMIKKLSILLGKKGYKVKLMGGDDLLIAMTEEEYMFLKLKYE